MHIFVLERRLGCLVRFCSPVVLCSSAPVLTEKSLPKFCCHSQIGVQKFLVGMRWNICHLRTFGTLGNSFLLLCLWLLPAQLLITHSTQSCQCAHWLLTLYFWICGHHVADKCFLFLWKFVSECVSVWYLSFSVHYTFDLTNYFKLGDLKQEKFIISQIWKPQVQKSQCVSGAVFPPEALWEIELFAFSNFWSLSVFLDLWLLTNLILQNVLNYQLFENINYMLQFLPFFRHNSFNIFITLGILFIK